MGLLKSVSKSMKGTFVGDLVKSADKAMDKANSYIDERIDDAISGVSKGAKSIVKEAGKKTREASEYIVKRTDQVIETASSFVEDCVDNAISTVSEGTKSIAKGAEKVADGAGVVAKGAGKMARVASGYEAYDSRKKAKETKAIADSIIANIEEEDKRRREETNRVLQSFSETKTELLQKYLSPFLSYIRAMGNDYKEKVYEFGGEVYLDKLDIKALETIEMNASTAGKVALASSTAAAIALFGVPAATTWAVGTFAAASTGTAISSLSGAAASNAILAWLGGGSLASGGGGIVAGKAVLTAIKVTSTGVFALVAANIIASAYFSKKYTEATCYLEEAKKARAKAKLGWKVMEAINQRAMELESVMKKLGDKIEDELLYLEPLVYDFQSEDEYYLETFSKTSVLVKALSEVAQVPLIDKNGELSNESSVTIVNTQKILNKNL